MVLRETTIARLGLVALAVSLWKSAGPLIFDGLLPRYPVAVVLLAACYVASFVALLVAASSSEKIRNWTSVALVAFALAVAAYAFRDGVRRAYADFYPTTDGHLFMETAARYLLDGKNPYAMGLAEGFRVYRMPLSHVTPLLDGDFSDRQAYPALSFLALVPALVAHVPTYIVYASAFIAAVAIAIYKAPWWARPIVVAVFLLDEAYFAFSFGGVTDTVWVLFVVGAVAWWRSRPTAAAILIGLACAYKQHPWFLVPLLIARIAHETGQRPWGPACRRFLAIVAAVFLVIDLPFFLIGPHRWLLGIGEPLTAPMVQLSDGLTAFSMTGWIVMPRKGTSAIFWAAYGLALFAYVRHFRLVRDWCWVVPAVVLWFSYRALMSYWYYFAIVAVVAMSTRSDDAENDDAPSPSWRPTVIAGGVFASVIAIFFAWCATRPRPFDLALNGPIEAWDRRAFVVRVRVTNHLDRTMWPQFWLQSTGQQPLPWVIDFGPHEVGAGKSAEYVIRASHHFKEFDIVQGARLELHDREDPGRRVYLSIPAEPTISIPDAIPNPEFRVLETRTRVPTGWAFESTVARLTPARVDDVHGRLSIAFGPGITTAPASPMAACVVPQHVDAVEEGTRRAVLSTVLPLPEGRIRFDVNVPQDANRPPYEKQYGIMLALRGFRVAVLLGEDVDRGTLPNGDVFVGLAVPRGQWTTVDVNPRAILERLKAPLTMTRYPYLRAALLDFPSTPLELGLFATAPATGSVEVQFGRIEQPGVGDYDAIAKHPAPHGLDAWRAELDLENGNFWKAWNRYEQVNAVEPTTERLIKQADAYLAGYQFMKAHDTYLRAGPNGDVPEAEAGMGFALVELGDYVNAKIHLERARDAYRVMEKAPPRFRYLATLRGLARIHVKKGECVEALRLREDIIAEAPSIPPPIMKPCE